MSEGESRFSRWCEDLEIPFEPAWASGLEAHLELLARWAPRVNLVSLSGGEDPARRHALDSLTLLRLESVRLARGPAADLGSGAGFPGIPLAVACPDAHWTLIEPRKKRGAFLTQAIARAGLRNAVWCETRTPDPTLNDRFDLVVSRATMEPATLLEHAGPLLRDGGRVALMAARVPGALPDSWRLVESRELTLDGAPRWIATALRLRRPCRLS